MVSRLLQRLSSRYKVDARGHMLKHSIKISYRQGVLPTRSNYKENWYAKTFSYEEGALKSYQGYYKE